jgi:hypothetical protein
VIEPSSISERLSIIHSEEEGADLTFLTAMYEPPKNSGKGRVLMKMKPESYQNSGGKRYIKGRKMALFDNPSLILLKETVLCMP